VSFVSFFYVLAFLSWLENKSFLLKDHGLIGLI